MAPSSVFQPLCDRKESVPLRDGVNSVLDCVDVRRREGMFLERFTGPLLTEMKIPLGEPICGDIYDVEGYKKASEHTRPDDLFLQPLTKIWMHR